MATSAGNMIAGADLESYENAPGKSISGIYGALVQGIMNSSGGTVTDLNGSSDWAFLTAGTATRAYGTSGTLYFSGGTVTGYAAAVSASNLLMSANVAELDGVYVSGNITGGSVANRFGIHVTVPSGAPTTNDFGVGVDSTTAKNYFMGNVGIGTTTPQASLDVKGMFHLNSNSSQPTACTLSIDGNVARTSHYTFCICKGGSSSWVSINDGSTSCTW